MGALTRRQRQVYDFLTDYQQTYGSLPTLQEIAAHLGISGNLGVLRHLQALERTGLIERRPGHARGIVLTAGRTSAIPLPVLGTVRAGQPQPVFEEHGERFAVDTTLIRGENSFLLRVQGDSMIGAHIVAGDLAVVHSQPTAENGAIVVALVDGEATLKRFFREADGRIRLQPDNPAMAPLIIGPEQAELVIIGKVTGICRPLG